jgi:outer membrane protein assembly factor BamB
MGVKSPIPVFLIALLISGFPLAFVTHSGLAQDSTKFKISGYILDSNGQGIGNAMIIFNVPQIVPSVYSDSSGYYEIFAPAGTYHFNVWPPFDSNYIYYDEQSFVVGSDIIKNITLNSGCKMSGYISDSSGNPVKNAIVLLNNYLSGWFSKDTGYYFVTAPSGTYTLTVRQANGVQNPPVFPTYYEYNVVVNGDLSKNIVVGGLTPLPAASLNVTLQTKFDGQAVFTNEKVHTSLNSAKLTIPENANQGSYAMALYPYNKPLNSISTFSIFASYVNATPRFVISIDNNTDGEADLILLSDYQMTSNGAWQASNGGSRWGWTEANTELSIYGGTWNQLDYWKNQYGNATALYVGIALEYWAVDPDGYGEPLYADELVLNGVTYNIAPVLTPAPSPASDSDAWPMFHNDLVHSGYSASAGPLTNQVLWKYQVGSAIESSPTVAYGVVYFGSLWNGHNGFVNALNATTGSKIWQFATDSGMESSPAVVDGVVYIGSWGGHVYALDAANGAEIWSFNAGGPVFPSPAVVDGIVYFGSEDQNFYALRASDGSQIWHYTTGGFIDSSPVVVGGIVYFGSRDGYVYALNASDGSKIWSFRPLHGNYGSYYYSTPAVAKGVIYVGGYDSYIYALNAANGIMFWEFRTGSYIFSSPIVAGSAVYVGSYDGNVYALDAITGNKIWNYQTGNKIRSSPAVANGVAYIGSDDGYLYAFGSPSGQPTSCKISGYILDANGHGIAGANIIFNVPSIVPSVWSDSSGYYVISAPAGTYHVNVWPPFDSNYINYDEPGFVVESDITKNITLYSGCKVSGYISDSSGNPVVGAAVLLRNSAGTFGSGWFSSSSGYYFLSVPAGTYTIDAHPRTGNYYSGPTTDFPTYYEYNFTVNADTVKNITVGNPSPTSTSSLKSEPASTAEPLPEKFTEPPPEPSSTPPATVTPDPITISTEAPPMTILRIVLEIMIVAAPFAVVSIAFLLFYLKKREH